MDVVGWGLIFILCVALSWLYVTRDSGRWKTAIDGAREMKLIINEQKTRLDSQGIMLRDQESRINNLSSTIMSTKTSCENLVQSMTTDVTKLREDVACEMKDVSDFQDHLARVREAQSLLCDEQKKLAIAQKRLTNNHFYLKGRLEAKEVIEFSPMTKAAKKKLDQIKEQLKEF